MTWIKGASPQAVAGAGGCEWRLTLAWTAEWGKGGVGSI